MINRNTSLFLRSFLLHPSLGVNGNTKAPAQIRVGAFCYVPGHQLEGNVVVFGMVLTTTLPFPPPILFVFFAGFDWDGREFEGLAASVRLVVGGLDKELKFVGPTIHGELHGHRRRILGRVRSYEYFFTADHPDSKIFHRNTPFNLTFKNLTIIF